MIGYQFLFRTMGNGWIGLNKLNSDNGHVWSDGTAFDYVNWNDGEPNNAGEEDCVVLWPDIGKILASHWLKCFILSSDWSDTGVWNDVPCHLRFRSVCEKRGDNYVPPPTPEPPVVQCEEGWSAFEDRCYMFSKTNANSWREASESCPQMNRLSTLTSITSQAQLEFILCKSNEA